MAQHPFQLSVTSVDFLWKEGLGGTPGNLKDIYQKKTHADSADEINWLQK